MSARFGACVVRHRGRDLRACDLVHKIPQFLTSGGRGCPPVPLINDSQNRVAVVGTQMCSGGASTPFTFKTAGGFLVICTYLPHFQAGMYGWVEVRDR